MTIMVTGADGYVGRRLSAALHAAGEPLLLAVRASDGDALARKKALLAAEVGEDVPVTVFDLTDPRALEEVPTGSVRHIIHSAAITRFNVDKPTAQQVNLEGTIRVCDFAAQCPRLERLTLVSALNTAGRHTGEIREEPHDDHLGHVNHYDWSKHASEVHALSTGLPVGILRLPTLISDDEAGKSVTQHNAFHITMKLYYYGLLSLVPGILSTPISLASAEFVTTAALGLMQAPPGIWHVCPDPDKTLDLGTIVNLAFDEFERDDAFRKRKVLRPLPCDYESFRDLVAVAHNMKGGPIHQAVLTLEPFAEHFYLPKTFHNDVLRQAWRGYQAPDPMEFIPSVCAHLVESRWGRNTRSNYAHV
jgi:nucleoside-diphosphate-sugar epimerase